MCVIYVYNICVCFSQSFSVSVPWAPPRWWTASLCCLRLRAALAQCGHSLLFEALSLFGLWDIIFFILTSSPSTMLLTLHLLVPCLLVDILQWCCPRDPSFVLLFSSLMISPGLRARAASYQRDTSPPHRARYDGLLSMTSWVCSGHLTLGVSRTELLLFLPRFVPSAGFISAVTKVLAFYFFEAKNLR